MKLSQWHYGKVKPVHVGVYETDSEANGDRKCYQYWDGTYWGWCCKNPDDYLPNSTSRYQNPHWRGIVKDEK